MYVCVYVYICTHTLTHTRDLRVYTMYCSICHFVFRYVYVCVCIHVHTHIHTPETSESTRCTVLYATLYLCMYMCVDVYMYTHTYTHQRLESQHDVLFLLQDPRYLAAVALLLLTVRISIRIYKCIDLSSG